MTHIGVNNPKADVLYVIHPPSPLCNPFKLTPHRGRLDILRKYIQYIKTGLELRDDEVFPEMHKIRIQARLALGRNKTFSLSVAKFYEPEARYLQRILEKNL